MNAHDDLVEATQGPVAELDQAPNRDVDHAELATQERLWSLLRVNQEVVEQLDLPTVLQAIVKAAVELVDAEYGALGVIDPVRGGLEQFIFEGISPQLAKRIGHLPEGRGILGALIDDPRPLRLEHLSEDGRSVGFPEHDPPMDSFLGVPIRIRGEAFGNLYLTNQRRTGTFTFEDQQLLTALATTAGSAIENARLFADTRRRQRWTEVTAEITAALLSGDQTDPLALIADRVLEVSNAAHVRVIVPVGESTELLIRYARGVGADIQGSMIPAAGTVARSVLEGKNPRLVDGEEVNQMAPLLPPGHGAGSIIAVPLILDGHARGVLIAVRETGSPCFTPSELNMVADFAAQATLALELSDARAARQRALLYEDRARIARDLHDHVIQQLFASGLELQSFAGTLGKSSNIDRINTVVANLDAAIRQIRTIIFSLSSTGAGHNSSLRHQILDLVRDFEGGLTKVPAVSFVGPVDLVLTGGLSEDVLAVVREALANIAKHAHARHVSIKVVVDDSVAIDIKDDGVGIPPEGNGRRSGLANLEQRALQRGGTFALESGTVGTRLCWHIPLEALDGADGN